MVGIASAPVYDSDAFSTLQERPDLVDKANPGVDLHVFRNEGFDF